MRYYRELTDLESSHIQLDYIVDLLSILSDSSELESVPRVQNSVWFLKENLEKIRGDIDQNFEKLFDVVRNDTTMSAKPVDYDQDVDFDSWDDHDRFQQIIQPLIDQEPVNKQSITEQGVN